MKPNQTWVTNAKWRVPKHPISHISQITNVLWLCLRVIFPDKSLAVTAPRNVKVFPLSSQLILLSPGNGQIEKHWAHTRKTPPGSTNAGCLTQSHRRGVFVTFPTPTATSEPRKCFEDEKCYLFAKYPLSAEKQHYFLHPNDSYTKFFYSQRSYILSKVGKK